MNANERRQAIWHSLCDRRHVTIAYLASLYHASRTTIKEDVDILSLSYPTITSRGYKGGIKLADWYSPGQQSLSPAQLNLLLRLSKTLSGDDAHIMQSIINQLSANTNHKVIL